MISIRQTIGILLALIAVASLYDVSRGLMFLMRSGSPIMGELQDPAVMLRLASGILAAIGGGMNAMGVKGGAWLAMIGAILGAALTGLLQAMSGDPMMVRQVGIYAIPVLILAIAAAVIKRAR